MSIFDLFTFKKQAESVFSKENIQKVLETAKEAIIEQAKNNFPGSEKKTKVDAKVIYLISNATSGCTNKLVLWLVQLIVKSIPAITQKIYDFLKEKVENL